MYWIGLGTEVVGLNSQVVPISQVVLKTGFTVVLILHETNVVTGFTLETCHVTWQNLSQVIRLSHEHVRTSAHKHMST